MKKEFVCNFRADARTIKVLKQRANKAEISESEFIRRLILSTELEPMEKDMIKNMVINIAAMGNNINQIARRINMEMYDSSDIKAIEEFGNNLYEYKKSMEFLRDKFL